MYSDQGFATDEYLPSTGLGLCAVLQALESVRKLACPESLLTHHVTLVCSYCALHCMAFAVSSRRLWYIAAPAAVVTAAHAYAPGKAHTVKPVKRSLLQEACATITRTFRHPLLWMQQEALYALSKVHMQMCEGLAGQRRRKAGGVTRSDATQVLSIHDYGVCVYSL